MIDRCFKSLKYKKLLKKPLKKSHKEEKNWFLIFIFWKKISFNFLSKEPIYNLLYLWHVLPLYHNHMLVWHTKEKKFFLKKVIPELQGFRIGHRGKNCSIITPTSYPHTTLRSSYLKKFLIKIFFFWKYPLIFLIFDMLEDLLATHYWGEINSLNVQLD